MPVEDVLLMLLTDEIHRREGSAVDRRTPKAGLEPDMVLERWDKTANVHLDRSCFTSSRPLRYLEARRNVVIAGPVGVGKTFLANAPRLPRRIRRAP